MSSRQIKIINKKSQQLGWVQWGGGVCWGTPSKDGRFFNRGFKFYRQRSNKIWTLLTNFSKVPTKKLTLQISFFKGCCKIWRFGFQLSFGDADKNGMSVHNYKIFWATSHTFLFLVKPSQNSSHQKDGNSFFWRQREDWKIHHQPYEPLKSAKNMIGRKKYIFQ